MAYTTRTKVERRYGTDNVATWATLSPTDGATEIAAVIADYIDLADAFIDDRLRLSERSFDLPMTLAAGTTPPTVEFVARRLVGYWLSTPRGVKEYDKDGNPLTKHYVDYRDSLEILELIVAGKLKFEGEQ